MTTFLIVTKTFEPLVTAQAKARKIATRLIVVDHPIGGLNEQELSERIEIASTGFSAAITI